MFSKTHQTTQVKFYDFNPYEDIKNLLVEVPIEKLAENSYSLNYAEYMKDDAEETQYEEGVVVKTLGEVCDVNQGNSLTKKEIVTGIYDVIGGGKVIGKHNEKNRDGDELTLTRVGDININYIDKPYYLTDNGFSVKSKKNDTITKYIFYLLLHNKHYLIDLYQGTAQKVISKTNLKSIKVPIPPIDRQHEIVKYLDFIYEKANKTSQEKIVELKTLNEYCLNTQKMFGDNVVKTLGEICKVNQGTYIKSDMKIHGEYPVYGGGNVSFYINQYNRENDIIVAKDGVSADCVRYENNKFFLNHHGWTIICKDIISKKYMFYYLQLIQPELLCIAKGTAQLGINQDNFYKLKIPIPSIERQKEIVEYCEFNDNLIKQLEKEIENNKKQAQICMSSIVKQVPR
jgi:restriction endonuclease S subunit